MITSKLQRAVAGLRSWCRQTFLEHSCTRPMDFTLTLPNRFANTAQMVTTGEGYQDMQSTGDE